MSDPLQQYSSAALAYVQAVQRARRIAEVVNRGATALRNWENVQVTGALGAFPEDVRSRRSSENDLSSDDWPGSQQIADVLLNYHRTRKDLESAYEAIPESVRHAVKNPEALTPPR